MIESGTESAIGLWTSPEVPLRVECPLEIMEDLRAALCGQLQQLSRGGIEAGGVLFGVRGEASIRILTWRPISREQAEGPSSPLSRHDRAEVARLLGDAANDPDLKALTPLGWFASPAHGGLALAAADVEIFDSFFPHPWQVTLILQPGQDGSARAGFFVRLADGSLKSDASYREFVVVPPRLGPVAPPVPARKAAGPAPSLEPPSFRMQEHSFGGARWLWALPVLLALALIGFLVRQKSVASSVPSFSLRVAAGIANLAEISWDSASPPIQRSDHALLQVQDGGNAKQIKLSAEQLRFGQMTYFQRTNDVGFEMTVYGPGDFEAHEFARLVARDSPAGDAPAAPESADASQLRLERDALATEVRQLKEQLRKEGARADKQQQVVRILENRLNVDAKRNRTGDGNQAK